MALRAAARTELLRRACRKPTVSGAEHRSLSGHMPDKPPVLAEERDSHASRAANQGGTTKAYVASRPERTRGFLFGSWGFPPQPLAACRQWLWRHAAPAPRPPTKEGGAAMSAPTKTERTAPARQPGREARQRGFSGIQTYGTPPPG